MNADHYKKVRTWSAMSPGAWCGYLDISKDTDKSYGSGRLHIPERVADMIDELATHRHQLAVKLFDLLKPLFPERALTLDETNLNITMVTADLKSKTVFVNKGTDTLVQPYYNFGPQGKEIATLLYTDQDGQVPLDWYLWRTKPQGGRLGYLEHSANDITRELLLGCEGI